MTAKTTKPTDSAKSDEVTVKLVADKIELAGKIINKSDTPTVTVSTRTAKTMVDRGLAELNK